VTPRARAAAGIRVRCPAKINLGLWILGARPDGYHEIDTVLQAVTLADDLEVETAPGGFHLETLGLPIPGPGPNILERAWALLAGSAGERGVGLRARLTKRIPAAAGLGGGSSDAAGLLVAADRLLGLGMGETGLRPLAVRLGADVPFFLSGGTARGGGRGDEVRQLRPIPPCWIVLACPPVEVSTTWAYGLVRNRLTLPGGNANILAAAIERADLDAIVESLHNDFEDVVLPKVSDVEGLRRALGGRGAPVAHLSGSGSTVFALTRTRDRARALALAGRRYHARVHVVKPYERGVTVIPLA
jgi:4-diphosphocytidyl-2-C-methyl-D-erythritol kinase